MERKTIYLVVRYGLLDDFDAIQELDKLIEKNGVAWFGKYGQPLSQAVEKASSDDNCDIFLTLVRKAQSKQYVYKTYSVKKICRTRPSDVDKFPEYYLPVLNRISTWVAILPSNQPQVDLKDLVTKSSAIPVLESLGSSMRGHFLCRLR